MDYTLSLTLGHQFYQTSPDGLQIIDTHAQTNMHIPWLILRQLYDRWQADPTTDVIVEHYRLTYIPAFMTFLHDHVFITDDTDTSISLQAHWFHSLIPHFIDIHTRIQVEASSCL